MRIVACLLLMVLAAGATAQAPVDYDLNNNNLIDVTTSTQLQAITHDLTGAGTATVANYVAAFPNRMSGMGCPTTCTGYELLGDIDLSDRDWQPIGGGTRGFYSDALFNVSGPPSRIRYNGIFEGNGHIIRGLRIRSSEQWNFVGMFSMLGPRGVIRNVGLVDVDVRVPRFRSVWTGALAGMNHGKIAASYVVSGTVSGHWYAGGLVGGNYARGRIIASYVNVTVQGEGSRAVIGGLSFNNVQQGRIIASYSLSEDASLDAGGLVGFNNLAAAGEAAVATSYYDSDRGDWSLGTNVPASVAQTGLALREPTTAVGIYAAWAGLDVDDTSSTVMGVVTRDDDNPWDFGSSLEYPVLRGVSARYPAGNTTNIRVQRQLQPRSVLASLAQRGGAIAEGSSVTYAVELTGVVDAATMTWSVELTGVGTGHAEASDFVGATRGQVVLAGTASAVFRVGIADDGTTEQREAFRVRLRDVQSPDDLDLRLRAASSAVVSFISPRGGMDYDTDGDRLIEVRTTTQLSAIRYDLSGRGRVGASTSNLAAYDEAFPSFDEAGSCAGACRGYELMNDLDLSGVDWTSIGGEDTQGRDIPLADARYEGIFEGNGYIISNLKINRRTRSRTNFVGLFGALGARGVIRSVGLVNADVVSSRIRAFGDLGALDNNYIGGLAGISYGTIAASYVVSGTVRGGFDAGGLAGTIGSGGTVIASYANVSVEGFSRVGGVAGAMEQDSLMSASYNIGKVAIVSIGRQAGGVIPGLITIAGGLTGDNHEQAEIQASYYERARSGQDLCCGNPLVMREAGTFKTSDELRGPTTTVGTIYAGWDRLNVNRVDENNDGDFNDDAPWDFGSNLDYPVLRGVSAQFPAGNSTNIGVQQRQLQPPVFVTLSQGSGNLRLDEGSRATYSVDLEHRTLDPVMVDWLVELTGTSSGHAAASDFSGATRGTITIVNTASGVFTLGIAADGVREEREVFRVRLSDLRGPGALRLSDASSAVESAIAASGVVEVDYDADGDNLIEVRTRAQLAAIRYDLEGRGLLGVDVSVDASSLVAYLAAFPFFDEDSTCFNTCAGYELSNDLDLSGEAWMPIGGGVSADGEPSEDIRYEGVFEGNGYVIRNMSITTNSGIHRHMGLFGALGRSGMIRNVGLVNVDVNISADSENIGGLVGTSYGTIAASYVVSGTVSGQWVAGGLVGRMRGNATVIASYANVDVTIRQSTVGGLVGSMNDASIVSASYAIGRSVSARVDRRNVRIGGLIGEIGERNDDVASIQASYYDHERSGLSSCCGHGAPSPDETSRTSAELRTPTTAEGIYAAWAGLNVDDTSSTVMGVLTLNDDAPWDFGSSLDYPVLRGVSTRYPDGNSTSIRVQRQLSPPVLVMFSRRGSGPIAEGSTVTYAIELSGGAVVDAATMTRNVGLAGSGSDAGASDFADQLQLSGEVVLVNAAGAIFEIRIARDGMPEPRERFKVQLSGLEGPDNLRLIDASSTIVSTIASNGTDYDLDDNNLIEVETTTQLKAIRYDLGGRGFLGVAASDETDYYAAFPLFDEIEACPGPDGCIGYELSNDLDLAGQNWIPIGGGAGGTVLPENIRYEAVFEGNGYVIRNMSITTASGFHRHMGLFGGLGRRGVIRNVGLVDVNVNIEAPAQSLNTGALVGTSYGTIAASYVAGGSLHSQWVSGGLVGRLVEDAVVIASYADVDVTIRRSAVGGLVGSMNNASIVSASYAIGREVAGNARIGGLIGERNHGTASIQASYYDRERSGLSSCCGHGAPLSDETFRRTSAELRVPTTTVNTIYAGWDQLKVDDEDQGRDGNLNDDSPWDFGNRYQYPVLRGVSARYPAGNSTGIGVQRRLLPQVALVALLAPARSRTTESEVELRFEVGLPSVLDEAVTVHYEVSGTATSGADYRDEDGGMVVIPSGTTRATIRLRLLDDYVLEPEEELVLWLARAEGGDTAIATTRFSTTIMIADDDRPVVVSARVYLQGAYVGGGDVQKTDLLERLPRSQPYDASPWNYPAPTTISPVASEFGLGEVTSTIVDWVLVELRVTTPGAGVASALSSAPPEGGRAAGLLLRDGRIVGVNEGATTLSAALSLDGVAFGTGVPEREDVYVLVHHRNHLAVMSARPTTDAAPGCEADYCVDFRNAQSYAGCAQSCGADGVCMMVAGDVNRSGVVSWGDDDFLLANQGAAGRYTRRGANYQVDADLDFSGQVSQADFQAIVDNRLLTSECGPVLPAADR